MPDQSDNQPTYQIKVQGHLQAEWSAWFDGFSIALHDDGTTLLSGPVTDQAALYGLLRKMRDLGLPLLMVVCSERSQSPVTDHSTKENRDD